jgi:hypothetical protein
LRTACSLAQWLNFHTLSLQYAKCPPQPAFHCCFPDVVVTSTYLLLNEEIKYVAIYLNDDLKPQLKIGTSSSHAVLNNTQWFILVTFKSDIPKSEVHELGESRHTLSTYCGRYIHVTFENTHVHLSKKHWSQLMDLASVCIDRQVIKFSRLHDELLEWISKCLHSETFCTTPNTNVIDFETLYDELVYRTNIFNLPYRDDN